MEYYKQMEESYKKTMTSLEREKELMENEFNEQTEMLRNMIELKDKELTLLRKENKDLKSTNKGNCISENLYDELKSQYDRLIADNDHLKEENSMLKVNIDTFEEAMKKFIQEKKEMRNEINELAQIVDEKRMSNTNLIEENKSMKNEIIKLEKDVYYYKNELEKYKTELINVKNEKDKVESSTKELMVYNNKLKEENEVIKQLNKTYQQAMETNSNKTEDELKVVPEKKEKRHNSIISTKDEKNNQLLHEILSDYLVKTNMNQYSIDAFKIVENIMVNLSFIDDTLQNITKTEAVNNELMVVIYSDIRKFFLNNLEKIQDIKLKNYLDQCSIIKQINYDKDIIELIKKVKYFNDQNNKIFEYYKKKKENAYKIAENNFEIIKNYFLKNYCENYENSTLLNFKIIRNLFTLENKELIIDFKKIKYELINDNIYSLYPFFIKNKIIKAEKLKIYFNSKFNTMEDFMFIIYLSKFYNKNIISLSLYFDEKCDENLISLLKTKLALLINLLNNLKTLEINNINLFTNKEEANNLLNSLSNSKIINLTLINCLKNDSTYYISSYLSQVHNLVNLNLSNNFGSNILISIDSFLLKQTELLNLNLSGNNLNASEFQTLSNFLNQDTTKLKELNISKNTITVESANLLGLSLKKIQTLEVLNISKCKIETDEFNFIINKETTKSIKELILSYNNIGNTGIAALISYLRESTNIQKLYLQKCNVTLDSFFLLKMNICFFKFDELDLHLEDNSEIEKDELYNVLTEDNTLQEKNITIYISAFYCTQLTMNKLLKLKYLKMK